MMVLCISRVNLVGKKKKTFVSFDKFGVGVILGFESHLFWEGWGKMVVSERMKAGARKARAEGKLYFFTHVGDCKATRYYCVRMLDQIEQGIWLKAPQGRWTKNQSKIMGVSSKLLDFRTGIVGFKNLYRLGSEG